MLNVDKHETYIGLSTLKSALESGVYIVTFIQTA